MITKIAEEIKRNNTRFYHKNGKHSKKVRSRIFDDSFKITRGLTQNINQRYSKKLTRNGTNRTSYDPSALKVYDGTQSLDGSGNGTFGLTGVNQS